MPDNCCHCNHELPFPFNLITDTIQTILGLFGLLIGLVVGFIILGFYCTWWVFFGDAHHISESIELLSETHTIVVDYQKVSGRRPISLEEEIPWCQDNATGKVRWIAGRNSFVWDPWIMRKSSKMYRAVATAGMNVAALRSYLAVYKLTNGEYSSITAYHDPGWGSSDNTEEYPNYGEGPHYVGAGNYCDSDLYSNVSVDLNAAPRVKLWWSYKSEALSGMCLMGHCSFEDSMARTGTQWKDLEADSMSLTDGQEKAYAALMDTGSVKFWLKVAHANGVWEDTQTIAKCHSQQKYIDWVFPPEDRTGIIHPSWVETWN